MAFRQFSPTGDDAGDSTRNSEELRPEKLLLQRLQNEPPIKSQLPPTMMIIIIAIVLGLSVVVYFISARPEKFADDPHSKAPAHNESMAIDSSEILAKRLHFGPILDSLHEVVQKNPDDADAHLQYANVLYETELWNEAEKQYTIYLSSHPKATDARIDYAFVVVQTTHDFKKGLTEIEKALAVDPKHIKGLFNAGLFSVQAFEDRKLGIVKAEEFFKRAKAAAIAEGDNEMSANVDKILAEIESIKSTK